MRFLIINGPNLNMLGIREPELYGTRDFNALQQYLVDVCRSENIEPILFQSNHEGAIVDRIQQAYQQVNGIIINPAAYTHTSVAILDALKAVAIPAVEVHLTPINERESFRHLSYPGMACLQSFIGKGFESYREGILFLKNYLCKEQKLTGSQQN